MSDDGIVKLTDPIEHSIGGRGGHILRRVFHISMSIIPFLYYWKGEQISDWMNGIWDLGWSKEKVASACVLLLILAETIRLKLGITIYGQRDYEAKQVSALAWGALGVGMVCLYAPEVGIKGAALGVPIILSLSLGDPLIGEMRRSGMDESKVLLFSSLMLALLWAASAIWLATPWWMVPLFAPLCVLAEKPRLKWMDDNATMTLIPLAAAMVLAPWIAA